MGTSRAQPLWLCLYFPDLPLDLLRLGDKAPAAVTDKQRIAFANKTANAAGIYPDMRLATAHALLPDITVVERKADKEEQALEELVEYCYQFTPTVMAYKDYSVLLEIGGSLTLFKGVNHLLQQIGRGLHYRGYYHCSALAHTKEAAWMFSHCRAEQDEALLPAPIPNQFHAPEPGFWLPYLKALPLYYLDVGAKKQQQLLNMGFGSLGDVLALPRHELGKRFGRALLDLLTAVVGDGATVDTDFQPAKDFSAQLDFATGITKTDELDAPLEQLLAKLLRFLNQQQLYTQQLEWQFHYFKQPCDKLIIHTSPANNNLSSLMSLSRIKLEQYTLKAPLEALALVTDSFTQAAATSGELFPELSHPSNQLRDYRQLLDKLRTRLGSEQLLTISVGNEHLPDYQQILDELSHEQINKLNGNAAKLENQNHRHLPLWSLPLWLTPQAQPIQPPGQQPGPLRLVYGPQRVDSHWWDQRRRRDYFIARHQNGSYCWVFRDLKTRTWFLQGFYG